MIDDEDLRLLGVGRWTVPLLAEIQRRDGARFAELLATLGIARDSLVRTLEYAIANAWVMRNPGYGHPLRPEYILTDRGRIPAAASARLMATRRRLSLAPESLPRWSLPIIGRLARDWTRFSELRASLETVTPRALSLNLKQMIEGSVVDRQLLEGFPPASLYGLAPPGRELWQSLRLE